MTNQLIEYMKLHLISLRQDWDDAINNIELIDSEYHPSDDYFEGAIETITQNCRITQLISI